MYKIVFIYLFGCVVYVIVKPWVIYVEFHSLVCRVST